MDKSCTVASARLIAAAPEMLDALRELVAEFDACPPDCDPESWNGRVDTGGIVLARLAVRKATGEE